MEKWVLMENRVNVVTRVCRVYRERTACRVPLVRLASRERRERQAPLVSTVIPERLGWTGLPEYRVLWGDKDSQAQGEQRAPKANRVPQDQRASCGIARQTGTPLPRRGQPAPRDRRERMVARDYEASRDRGVLTVGRARRDRWVSKGFPERGV